MKIHYVEGASSGQSDNPQAIDLEVLPDGRFRLDLGFCGPFFTAGKLLAHSLAHMKRGNMN